jgi:hypothetical protein
MCTRVEKCLEMDDTCDPGRRKGIDEPFLNVAKAERYNGIFKERWVGAQLLRRRHLLSPSKLSDGEKK